MANYTIFKETSKSRQPTAKESFERDGFALTKVRHKMFEVQYNYRTSNKQRPRVFLTIKHS